MIHKLADESPARSHVAARRYCTATLRSNAGTITR